jgi:hypothetical protein
VSISTKHKHLMLRRIYSSFKIPQVEKEAMMQKLEETEKDDRMEETKYYCRAALPTRDDKQSMWTQYFDTEIDWPYSYYGMSFAGFNQVSQRHLLLEFKNKFFARISEIFKKKGRFVAELYFAYLQPNMYADDETIEQFEALLTRVKIETPDNSHFIKLI